MAVLSLIISIIALICAYVVYTKCVASTEDLKGKAEEHGLRTETFRSRSADMIEILGKMVRGSEKKPDDQPDNNDPA